MAQRTTDRPGRYAGNGHSHNGTSGGGRAGDAPVGEKLLPQSEEAEVGVVGSLLIDPEAISRVADTLRPDDFYIEKWRAAYQAAADLTEAGVVADAITLGDELARRGQLEEIGGYSGLTALALQVPSHKNITYYARIVQEKATLRRLIQAAGHIAGEAYHELPADIALANAETGIAAIIERHSGAQHTARSLGEALKGFTDRLDLLQQQQGQTGLIGIPSGLRDLDALTSGWRKGNLVVLAARPSVGKSAMALAYALTAAKAGYAVAFFSLEMSEDELLERIVAMESGVEMTALRTGRLDDAAWEQIMAALGRLADLPFYLEDTPALTVADVRRRVRRQRLDHRVDMVLVDYLQIMGGATSGDNGNSSSNSYGNKTENRVQEVSAISRGLKNLARELEIPVIALSQLSRAVESRNDKKPLLSDLRESGSIEQDADLVIFIYRDELYNPETERQHIADVILAKHRNGAKGEVEVYFDGARTRYLNLERRPLDDSNGSSGGRDQWWTGEQPE